MSGRLTRLALRGSSLAEGMPVAGVDSCMPEDGEPSSQKW